MKPRKRKLKGKEGTELLMEALAEICDGPSVDLHFGDDGALISMREDDQPLWSDSMVRAWTKMSAHARAGVLLYWLFRAAEERKKRREKKSEKRHAA